MIDIIGMIPSQDLREWLHESGRVFTDREKAAIVHNLHLAPERTRELLEQLERETDDEGLRAQLHFRLAEDERLMKWFQEDAHNFIFGVKFFDEDYNESDGGVDAYFSNFTAAFDFGSAHQLAFEVTKWRVYDHAPEGDVIDRETYVGSLCFDTESELTSVDLWDLNDSDPQWAPDIMRGGEWPYFMFFEDRWIDLPNLYENGDIVHVLVNQSPYIDAAYDWAVVNVDAARWEARRQRISDWLIKAERDKGSVEGVLGDYSDMQVLVEIPCKDGTFVHDHINPMFLERVTEEAEGDEAELRQMAQWAVRDECGLEWISRVLKKQVLTGLSSDKHQKGRS